MQAFTTTHTANVEQFNDLTKDLSIVFPDGTHTPYRNLVKGFVVDRGDSLTNAILDAARAVCGPDVHVGPVLIEPDDNTITKLQDRCHEASYAAGWWHHPDTGLPYIPGDEMSGDGGVKWQHLHSTVQELIIHYWPFVVATKIALVHSEVSEGLEAFRRGAMDDKLSHRLGLETEFADSMIRQLDIAGVMRRARRLGVVEQGVEFDMASAFTEKMAFNAVRPDHKVAARRAAGGKVF